MTDTQTPEAGGFFRSISETALTLLHEAETVVMHPSRIVKLGWTPAHRDIVAASEADFKAQEAADAKAAAERAAARDAVAAQSAPPQAPAAAAAPKAQA